MVNIRWSDDETFQFVKLILQHECLWNPHSPEYKIKPKRQNAYKEIMEIMKETTRISLNEVEMRMKIKSLRSTYSQELKKIRNRFNQGITYVPILKWFKLWHSCHENKQKLPMSNDDQEDSKTYTKSDELELNDSDQNIFEEADGDQYIIISKPEPEDEEEEEGIEEFHNSNMKRRKLEDRNLSIDHSDNTFHDSVISNNSVVKEDEFDIYGKYIASQLRSMGLKTALRLQLRIHGIVNEARISDM